MKPLRRASGSFWRHFGVWTFLAGLAFGAILIFTEHTKQTEPGDQMLGRVSACENPRTEEAAAVAQLFQTSLDTRAQFFSRALSTVDIDRLVFIGSICLVLYYWSDRQINRASVIHQ